MSSDESVEYFSAEEYVNDDHEEIFDGFYIWTSTDGTKWYLPKYYRADIDLIIFTSTEQE